MTHRQWRAWLGCKSITMLNTNIDAQQVKNVEHLIQQVLADVLPYVQSHGGHVEFVYLKNNVVYIKFSGTCVSCPLSFYTVTYGIERHIKSKVASYLSVEVIEE